MKILQLHNHHASLGGAMEVLSDEAILLEKAGNEVDQYTLPAAETMGLSSLRAGAKAVWNVEASREVGRRIDSFAPDVVHVHTPFPLLSPAVFRTAARRGVPTVATVHSFRYSCIAGTCNRDGKVCEDCVGTRFKLAGVRHRCYHDNLGASVALTLSLNLHRRIGTFDHGVTRFLTLTQFAKRLLVRDGVSAEQITVKSNSVPDPGEPDQDVEPEPYVAFAGRLMDIKGVHTLLEAWSQLPDTGLRLRIAGDGPLRDLVESHVSRDSRIDFLGWVDQSEVTTLMARATAVLVPSEWYEGFPLVVCRSLSTGTPVITSDLENICEEVVADDAGVAFKTGDPSSLAAALRTVTDDRPKWLARRAVARASYCERYRPSTNLAALLAIYAEVSR